LGCPRPKYFFSGLPNLLLQKIRLPLISFFSRVSYIWGSYIWGSSKNFPCTTHTDKHSLESVTSREVTYGETGKKFQELPGQIDSTVALILM